MNLATSSTELRIGRISRFGTSLRRASESLRFAGIGFAPSLYFAALGRFAPYFERACLRSLTPAVSRLPRTMW